MSSPASAIAFRARWLITIDQPPIDGGIVTIVGDRITVVGRNDSGRPPLDLGDVAILPGLINAHTHLEFSQLVAPLGQFAMPLADWIPQVVQYRRQRPPEEVTAAIRKGLQESTAAGVVALGEIATPGGDFSGYAVSSLETTVFLELLSLQTERIGPLLEMARHHIAHGGSSFRPGLSPHAPYSVHPQLLKAAYELSAAQQIPLAMHVAESRDELELLAYQSGPLVEMLKSLGAWRPDAFRPGLRPLDYLQALAAAHRALVIHGNYLANDEIEFLAANRDKLTLIYCPRTHAYFGHDPYPLAQTLAAGVRVAIGTDSRASNPDLRPLEELRHIAKHHSSVAPDEILRLGTINGAEALERSADLGSISAGKLARLLAIPLSAPASDPLEQILHGSSPVQPLDLQTFLV